MNRATYGRMGAALLVFAGCSTSDAPSDGGADLATAAPFVGNCTAGALSAEAKKTAGAAGDGTAILPGGRRVAPAGTLYDLGGYPLSLRVIPGDRYVVVSDGAANDEALRVVDLQAADPHKAVVQSIAYPWVGGGVHSPGLYYGLALTADGKRLYVSNGSYDPTPGNPAASHYNTVEYFDVTPGSSPVLTKVGAIELPFAPGVRGPAGLTLSADEKLLLVACQGDSSLSVVNLEAGAADRYQEIGRTFVPGLGAYDVAVSADSKTAFVSMWGGLAKSANRFVDGVVAVDLTNPRAPVPAADLIPTGKASEAELLLAGKLYVANADADTVSVVDVATRQVKSMPVTAGMILGASPTALAIEPQSATSTGRIYVANSGENSVVVLDLQTLAVLGRIPTAYYPTAVGLTSKGDVVIASARGLGIGPTKVDLAETSYEQGTLQRVPRPSDADLKAGDAVALDNFNRPVKVAPTVDCTAGQAPAFPVPVPGQTAPSPIRYVFMIVKENKTYDMVLGDLKGANGDPSLCLFGEENTPNTHALARGWVNLDNFYSHAEMSTQGHQWTTAAISNDYVEKNWATMGGSGRDWHPIDSVTAGPNGHLGFAGGGAIWQKLEAAGIAYRDYGEVTNLQGARIGLDKQYPGFIFSLEVSDADKARYIVAKLNDATYKPEPFHYILMPVDHTYGTSKGRPTPQSMVADNDEGVGIFLDGLSHSPYWAESLVFITEDDPQDGGDHVEGHRTVGLLVSPWVKRGYVSSGNYDMASVYRTIELILGVGAMNTWDQNAAPMYDAFTSTPDLTPYTYVPRKIPPAKNSDGAPLQDESDRIDFSKPDQAPLGRILWKAVRGANAEPPWRRAGVPVRFVADDDD